MVVNKLRHEVNNHHRSSHKIGMFRGGVLTTSQLQNWPVTEIIHVEMIHVQLFLCLLVIGDLIGLDFMTQQAVCFRSFCFA